MKKQLWIGTALLAATSAFPQQRPNQPGIVDMAARWAARYETRLQSNEGQHKETTRRTEHTAAPMQRSGAAAPFVWNSISSSMNINGVLESSSKPLQYDDALNAVSFIHRKSLTYAPNPYPTPLGAETGAIVGMVSTNWGTTWDSTCIWNNNTYWARYPQGGIYNSSPTNTVLANAHIVVTGPLTPAAGGWSGDYFASKPLSSFDNVASTTPGAQQFMSSAGPTYGPIGKINFTYNNFSSNDDGSVWAIGGIYDNPSVGGAAAGYRGPRMARGIYTSGVFSWTGDSVPILVTTDNNTGQYNWFGGRQYMAWNEAGTVGYVWYIGCRTGATGNNVGYQPVVFKSTNSGNTWAPIPGIDFNDPVFKKPVLDHLLPVTLDHSKTIPFFNFQEGFDGTVDKNGQLHMMSAVWGTAKAHQDSLGYAYTDFQNWDGEIYTYQHGPVSLGPGSSTVQSRPYIYDFYTTTTGWNVAVIDSLPTEAPGESTADAGYADNPWDGGDNGAKAGADARLQMSRTPDGSKIIYTWAESDTGLTNQGRKWNHLPNLRARMMDVSSYTINPTEFRLTTTTPVNPFVKDRAVMHNTSPKCAISPTTAAGYTITVPVKVTNNQNTPMTQLLPNTHWYCSVALEFTTQVIPDGITEVAQNISGSILYPNPAAGKSSLKINLDNQTNVTIDVYSLTGQLVGSSAAQCEAGENMLPVPCGGLQPGIYLVQLRAGTATGIKKMIVE